MKLHGDLKSNCPKINVIEYFNHSSMAPFEKDEWVLGLMVECGSFINMTNNCMESINGKLKEVGNKSSQLITRIYYSIVFMKGSQAAPYSVS